MQYFVYCVWRFTCGSVCDLRCVCRVDLNAVSLMYNKCFVYNDRFSSQCVVCGACYMLCCVWCDVVCVSHVVWCVSCCALYVVCCLIRVVCVASYAWSVCLKWCVVCGVYCGV